MREEMALRKYEDLLLGKLGFSKSKKNVNAGGRVGVKSTFSLSGPGDLEREIDVVDTGNEVLIKEREKKIKAAKERDALAIFRYAITGILGWTPQEAAESLTTDIVKQLYLDRIIEYIQFPKDMDRSKDYAWVVSLAFPDDVSTDVSEQILGLYKRVRSGELKRFPKLVFDGEDGYVKLGILLNDYISKNVPASSVQELYDIFSDNARGNVMMHEAYLYHAYHEFYDTPLEYLHDALGSARDDFLFDYYQFMAAYRELETAV